MAIFLYFSACGRFSARGRFSACGRFKRQHPFQRLQFIRGTAG